MQAIVLHVVAGADAGKRFTVPVGSYRVLGRGESLSGISSTAVVSHGDKRRLEREDQHRASAHLAARAAPGLHGARSEVAAFVRERDIELLDEAVSQTHAMVFCDEAGASLIDVASTNGTFVNGDKATEAAIVSGDLIRVGETRMEVELSQSAS